MHVLVVLVKAVVFKDRGLKHRCDVKIKFHSLFDKSLYFAFLSVELDDILLTQA